MSNHTGKLRGNRDQKCFFIRIKFAMSPYENWQELAWAGVFLITVAVLGLNILARVLTRQK